MNAVKDINGNSRPITLFKMGGLTFEAVAGSRASLTLRNSDEELTFRSAEDSLIVSAPFEGGKLTLRMLRGDDFTPIYQINLRTGAVQITPKFEFVSFEIGGFVIPQSEAFKMTYNAATEKFSFAINNLVTESQRPEGTPKAYEFNEEYRTTVQTFDANYRITNPTYQYAMGNWEGHTADSFRNRMAGSPQIVKTVRN